MAEIGVVGIDHRFLVLVFRVSVINSLLLVEVVDELLRPVNYELAFSKGCQRHH